MKFTKSLDGELRGDLPIVFRVGRRELIHAFCKEISVFGGLEDGEYPEKLGRRKILDIAKKTIKSYGIDGIWELPAPDEGGEDIIEFVTRQVDKHFPELKDEKQHVPTAHPVPRD